MFSEFVKTIPIIAGAVAITQDGEDTRRNLSLALCVGIAFLLVLQGMGIDGGAVGQTIISAFLLMLGYYFGQKESEARCEK